MMAEKGQQTVPKRRRLTVAVLGSLLLGGVAGLALSGVIATALERTSTNAFCVSCHEMAWPDETYQQMAHFTNPSGVRASCASCHLSAHPWWELMYQKGRAGLRDVVAHVAGTLDRRDAYEARRREMAETVWAQLEQTDSRWCRNCHSQEAMALNQQSPAAGVVHRRALDGARTCIDCHKGVGHGIEPAAG